MGKDELTIENFAATFLWIIDHPREHTALWLCASDEHKQERLANLQKTFAEWRDGEMEQQAVREMAEKGIRGSRAGTALRKEIDIDCNDVEVTRNDERFKRLSHLFFRKLSREQRIKVLVALVIMPADFRPTPVWQQRGLEFARRENKLQEFWGYVMRLLPSGQRESNPF